MTKFFLLAAIIVTVSTSVFAQSTVSTWAGDQTADILDGPRLDARFRGPFGMAISRSGNIYVADAGNNCIRKIDINGTVSTLAGSGVAGWIDATGTDAQFNDPSDLCVDDSENVYVADFENQRIRRIAANGAVTTIAGSGDSGYVDAKGVAAKFNFPRGITRDRAGNLYVGDSWNHRIRKITPEGDVSTFAGGGTAHGVQSAGSLKDGPDTTARFATPCGVFADSADNIFVADAYNHRIRKISPAGVVTTFAGSGPTGNGSGGFADGDSSKAILNTPTEVFVGKSGVVYFTEVFGERVRLCLDGTVLTIAGDGNTGLVNGPQSTARFDYPRGIVTSLDEKSILVCDNVNNCIRSITKSANAIKEPAPLPAMEIFPNPFHNSFWLQTINIGKINPIIIYDIAGKVVASVPSDPWVSSFTSVNLTSQPPGMYYIRMGNGASVGVEKR